MKYVELNRRFDEIYNLYSKDIYRLVYSYLFNISDTEDILQKTFLKLYKNNKILSLTNDEIKKWLFKVSINETKDTLKSPWRRLVTIWDKEDNISLDLENKISEPLKNIPKEYRIPLYLYYYEGYSIKEIANLIKKTESAVKMRLSRGKEKLKIEMEKE